MSKNEVDLDNLGMNSLAAELTRIEFAEYRKRKGHKCRGKGCGIVQGMEYKGSHEYYCEHTGRNVDRALRLMPEYQKMSADLWKLTLGKALRVRDGDNR